MKVLHLSSEKTWRGGEQQIAYLVEELQILGVENVVASKKGSVFEQYAVKSGLTNYSFSFKNSVDIGTALRLKKLAGAINPDIIHAHTSKGHGIIAIAGALGLRSSIVLSRRVDFELKKSGFSNWKYNLPQIKKILCVSDEIKRMVQKSIKNPDRAVTVYSGVKLNRFKNINHQNYLKNRFQLPHDSFLIGNTSAIADHKDYFTFVDTAKKIVEARTENVFFFIIGDGPMREEIKSYVKDTNLEKRVFFTGFIDNIPEVLQELDVFLMTSKTEGLGTSVLDAFASGLTVVSTNGGGLKETVHHNETGLLANVGDSGTLAKYVIELMNDSEQKNRLTQTALTFVQKFSKQNTAKKTYQIYQDLIS